VAKEMKKKSKQKVRNDDARILNGWFDISGPIPKDELDGVLLRWHSRAIKQGEDPSSPENEQCYQQMRDRVERHNNAFSSIDADFDHWHNKLNTAVRNLNTAVRKINELRSRKKAINSPKPLKSDLLEILKERSD
jgi:hypothetical protein